MESINKSEEKEKGESLKFSLLMTEKSTHEIFVDQSSEIITLDQKKLFQRKMTWHPPRNKFLSGIISPQLFKCKSFDENRESVKNRVSDQFIHKIHDERSDLIITIKEEEEELPGYDPYKIPFDKELLNMHRKAIKFGLEWPEPQRKNSEEESKIPIENGDKNDLENIKEQELSANTKDEKINSEESEKKSNLGNQDHNSSECPCCGEPLEKKPANLCVNSSDLEFLGYAYPLFIKIAKSLICFVSIPFFFLVFVPHLVFLYQECQPDEEIKLDLHPNSLGLCETGNVIVDLVVYYAIIDDRILWDLIFSIYLSVFAVGLRIYCLRYIENHKQKNSIRKHTVYVKDLPKIVNEIQVTEFFESLKLNKKYSSFCFKKSSENQDNGVQKFYQKPYEINFIYDLTDYLTVSNYVVSMINMRRKYLSLIRLQSINCPFKDSLNENAWKDAHQMPPFCTCISQSSLEQLLLIDRKIVVSHKKKTEIFQNLQQNPKDFSEKRFCKRAFITFKDSEFVDALISNYGTVFSFCDRSKKKFQDNSIWIERAPDPEEILWENFGVPLQKKIGLRILILFCEAMVLVLSAFLIRNIYHNLESNRFEKEFSVGVLILFINRILMHIIKKLVSHERHKSSSTNEKMMILAGFSFIIVNILLYEMLDYLKMMLNIQILSFENDDAETNEELEDFHKTIDKILFVSIFLSMIEPIIKFLFDYKVFIKMFKRRKILKNPNLYCQKEAHEAFEGVEFELAEYYSDFILVFLLGILGAPFFPLSFLIIVAGLIVQFWLFKINLIYKCQVEGELCRELMPIFLRIINLSPIFFVAGTYLNAQKLVKGEYRTENDMQSYFIAFLVEVCVVFAISCLDLEHFIKRRNEDKKDFEEFLKEKSEKGYNQLKFVFRHQK